MNVCQRLIRSEWGQALCSYEPASLTPWPLGSDNLVFLTDLGLPPHATDGGNLVIHFHAVEAFHFMRVNDIQGICIGETDVGVAILVDAHTGHVWAGDATGCTFMNASLKALLCCMVMYHHEFIACPLNAEDEGESDDDDLPGTPATRARADQLRARLNAIDPLALDASTQGADVSMWAYVVEEVEYGVI
ncbi:hypothetical protein GO986_12740 [Deinococcus sp. HMF7620]|uniref:SUKH-4 immunity protein n=1 Tax=Deinococcus arboris TaxID=2682977 RepID=A0A7C9HSB3_9DEIO|nr:hypothetical protein [Deinococcus arboris]